MRDLLLEAWHRLRAAGFSIVVGSEAVVPAIPQPFGLGLRKTGNWGLLEGWQVGYGGLAAAAAAGGYPGGRGAAALLSAALAVNATSTACEAQAKDGTLPRTTTVLLPPTPLQTPRPLPSPSSTRPSHCSPLPQPQPPPPLPPSLRWHRATTLRATSVRTWPPSSRRRPSLRRSSSSPVRLMMGEKMGPPLLPP